MDAASEIRRSTDLIRAGAPERAAAQGETDFTISLPVDSVGIRPTRAVEL